MHYLGLIWHVVVEVYGLQSSSPEIYALTLVWVEEGEREENGINH
jgi:hypothetical protein